MIAHDQAAIFVHLGDDLPAVVERVVAGRARGALDSPRARCHSAVTKRNPAGAALGGHTGSEVLLGIGAENIEAATAATLDAIAALTEAVESPSSHLLLTAVGGDQRPTLQTRTDFPAAPDVPAGSVQSATSSAGSTPRRPGRSPPNEPN